jgi:hypothetical protein
MKEANREVLDRGSLPELLARRARNASDKRLVLDAAIGFVVAATLAVLRPPLWISLAALAFSLGAFGVWGILDREASDEAAGVTRIRLLTGARAVAAVAGGVSAALFGVSFFFALLGQWIS